MSDAVVVVGDLMVDVVAVPEGAIRPGTDTPSEVRSSGGGSAANTACWLATTGRPVRLVAAVGDDPLGRDALAALEAAGVEFAGAIVPGAPTGVCVVLVDDAGERTMLPDRGANEHLPPQAVQAALAAPPAWLHLSGYTLLGAGSHAVGQAAMAAARRDGIPWSVDAASAGPLTVVGPTRFLGWIDGAHLLFANDEELAVLGAPLVLDRVDQLVAKHGPAGASWNDGTRSASVAALEATVVDTIGAGDAFAAGYIDAHLAGAEPADALAAGAGLAAVAVGRAGARP